MGDKLIIKHADGTQTEVEPLKPWTPDYPKGSLMWAMDWCKVRGYIFRKSNPGKRYWKNTLDFASLPDRLPPPDRDAMDWQHHDPQEDEGPLTA